MKCLIFIFTLCSIGTFINVQGETNEPSDYESGLLDEVLPKDSTAEDRLLEDEPGGGVDAKDDDPPTENINNKPGETTNSFEAGPSEDGKLEDKQIDKETMRLFLNEVAAGDTSDLVGQNLHIKQSPEYYDLGRRAVPQALKNNVDENLDYLTPQKAPPELVLLVAKESRLLRSDKDNEWDNFDQNKILRSGNYWDGVWKEDVVPKSALRSVPQEKQLGSIKAKINPGTEFYKVVSRMKKISPKLLYIINKV